MERPLPRSGDWVDTATVDRGRASTITTRRTRNGDHQLATRGDLNWPPVGTFPWPRTRTWRFAVLLSLVLVLGVRTPGRTRRDRRHNAPPCRPGLRCGCAQRSAHQGLRRTEAASLVRYPNESIGRSGYRDEVRRRGMWEGGRSRRAPASSTIPILLNCSSRVEPHTGRTCESQPGDSDRSGMWSTCGD